MPRAPKEIKKPAHRPEKPINWELVDELLEAGCMGTEIAPHFDMHPDTLYIRTEQEKGMGFTAYSQLKRAKGESSLKKAQYDKALGKTDKGDNTLLVWLGKVRLNQKESTSIEVAPETVQTFNNMMNLLEELQKNRQNQPNENNPG